MSRAHSLGGQVQLTCRQIVSTFRRQAADVGDHSIKCLGLKCVMIAGLFAPCANAQTATEAAPSDRLFQATDSWTSAMLTSSPDELTRLVASASNSAANAQIEYPIVPPIPRLQSRLDDNYSENSGRATFESDGGYYAHGDQCVPCQEAGVSRFRNQAFQGVQVAFGSVGGGTGEDYLNIDHFIVSGGVAIPLGSMEHVLMISPSFRADYLRFADGADIPESLYETGIRLFWKTPITEQLSGMVIVTPSIRSDFTTTQDAFRIFGMAMITWEKIPDELSLSAGFVYLDRSDLSAIPAVGLTWTPTPDWKLDLQFPQPRLAHRITRNGAISESWIYLAGGFGGNTWAVTRAGGISDELTISDLRMFVGYEKLLAENRGWFLEAGWAFNRSLEYSSQAISQDFSDALLLRAGISF